MCTLVVALAAVQFSSLCKPDRSPWRRYAAGPNLARGAYVSNLDEDNYLAPDHIGSLVTLLVEKELDWGYSLRTVAMLGAPHVFPRQSVSPCTPYASSLYLTPSVVVVVSVSIS